MIYQEPSAIRMHAPCLILDGSAVIRLPSDRVDQNVYLRGWVQNKVPAVRVRLRFQGLVGRED